MLPQMERDKLVAEWCRLVGKESQMRHVDAPKPQYEKHGQREAARMNMLLRQGGFGASCAKSQGRIAADGAGQAGGGVGTTDGEGSFAASCRKTSFHGLLKVVQVAPPCNRL